MITIHLIVSHRTVQSKNYRGMYNDLEILWYSVYKVHNVSYTLTTKQVKPTSPLVTRSPFARLNDMAEITWKRESPLVSRLT